METALENRAAMVAQKLREVKANELRTANNTIESGLFFLFNKYDAFQYGDFLLTICCLLTNPQVSSKLDEYYQNGEAGKICSSLIHFFYLMEDSSVETYLLLNELEEYPGNFTQEKLDNIEKYRLSD